MSDVVILKRISTNGRWSDLFVILKMIGRRITFAYREHNFSDRDEDEALSKLLDRFENLRCGFNLKRLRSKFLRGFRYLRENDSNGYSQRSMEIALVAEEQPEPHFSCKKNQNEDSTSSDENIISQAEIKENLAIIEKDNKSMKFFEDNKCCVCLSNYKEVLDDKLHIVVPNCGHPLCCGCADNILKGTKKECPRCRGNITADSFYLMKFNADLEMETQHQTVFL